jgi:hypothetical protein
LRQADHLVREEVHAESNRAACAAFSALVAGQQRFPADAFHLADELASNILYRNPCSHKLFTHFSQHRIRDIYD